MGLLYEKERRTLNADNAMPDVKEADAIKRSTGKVAPIRDSDDLDQDWAPLGEITEEDLIEGDLDAEDTHDEDL